MDPLPRFGRYEALFKIAAGGMAEVFAARIRGEAGFEKLVAVKRMLPHLAEDEQFVDMFLDEARVAVHVSSPHVVQTLDLGRAEDGALYIVMELVVGSALSTLVRDVRRRNGRVPIPIAVELIAQAAQGLDDAHEARTPTGAHLGIVHRDVSPHNILVGADGRARVTDFGIARAMMRRTATAVGELKGKFAYFSPEQAEGKPLDHRADLFALGIVAWEAIMGRRLFAGDDSMDILSRVKSQPIPLLHTLDAEVPHAVSMAIARALERRVDDRYATAAEMAHALREANRPAPSARDISRWVNDAGGETLSRVRGLLDQALGGDDNAVTVARASSPRVAPPPPPRELVTSNITLVPEQTGTVNATMTTTSEVELRRRSRAPLVIGALVVAALGGGIYYAAREPAPTPAATSEPAPLVVPSASQSQSAAPVADAAPSVVEAPQPSAKAPPKHKVKHPPAATATATAKVVAPVVTAPPPATTTTSTTAPPPKQPTGPILGDEAFDKK